MTRLPDLELACQILLARLAQFSNNLRILGRQPILQFIESFHRRKHGNWDLNNILSHNTTVSDLNGEATDRCSAKTSKKRSLPSFPSVRKRNNCVSHCLQERLGP